MSIKQRQMLVERIAEAISQGKTFHAFIFGEYWKSFYHREACECYHHVYKKDFSFIQLKGGKAS